MHKEKIKGVDEKMPLKANRPCSHPGCPKLTRGRFCEEHEKKEEQHYNKNCRPNKRLYSSANWKRLRINYLQSHPLCVICYSRGKIVEAKIVDHVVPHKGDKRLFFDTSNLQALCKRCHDTKTAKEDGRWKRRVDEYEK